MSIKQIKEYIETGNLKTITFYVKREFPEIYNEVLKLTGNSFTEKLYKYINNDNGVCQYGKDKTFISIKDGFRFCGRAAKCRCCAESVSQNVSSTKSKRSREQIEEENKKRVQTNLKKYGVDNTGKLDVAIQAHKKLYENKEKVKEINKRISETIKRNGTTFKKSEEEKARLVEIKRQQELEKNPNLIILYDKSKLENALLEHTVDEIADKAKCHRTTVLRNMLLHGIRDKRESSLESDMFNWLTSITDTEIVKNTRKVLPSGRELDIYLPEYNIAIEMNGEYFHSEKVRQDKNYHKDKFKECEENGIHLFTIFSNIWHNKTDIIKRMISHKIGISSKSIYARQTKVIEVDSKTAREFCETHHLKGYVNSSVRLGLEYNGELVSLMTLGKPRRTIGNKNLSKERSFEIYRLVSSENVVGGASKLLSHFEKTYNPAIVYSFSDNEYSQGNVYKKLGMELVSESVSYFYFKGGLTFSRNNFQKHKLVEQGHDPNKSETEIMDELGYYKVWDCGTRTWVKYYEDI